LAVHALQAFLDVLTTVENGRYDADERMLGAILGDNPIEALSST
jgi:hypothetical protein